MSLCYCSAVDLLGKLESGEVSSVELTSAFLDQIATYDPAIHAFLRVDRDAALSRAAEIDQCRRANQPLGRLAGLPVAVEEKGGKRRLETR